MMPRNDSSDIPQADTSTFEILHFVKSLEHSEQFGCILLLKTNSVITHRKYGFATLDEALISTTASSRSRVHLIAFWSRFCQTNRNMHDQVAIHFGRRSGLPFQAAIAELGLQISRSIADQTGHGNSLFLQFRPADLRETEQVVNERFGELGRLNYAD